MTRNADVFRVYSEFHCCVLRVVARGLFIAVAMVIHSVYFSIIEAGQVFAYDAFVRTRNS